MLKKLFETPHNQDGKICDSLWKGFVLDPPASHGLEGKNALFKLEKLTFTCK